MRIKKGKTIYYNILTEREKQILEMIAINGLNKVEIANKLYLSPNTVYSHTEAICNKLGFTGKSRIYQLIVFYWMNIIKGAEKMRNCTECGFYTSEEKCNCTQSEYLDEFVNEYMICREFKERANEKHIRLDCTANSDGNINTVIDSVAN